MGQIARHGAEPHGRHGRRQRLVDGRARKRAGLGATRDYLRHRLAPDRPRARRTGRCCPCSAILTARCSSAARSSFASSRSAARSRLRYYDHRFPMDPRDVSDASSATVAVRRRGPRESIAGLARLWSRCAALDPCARCRTSTARASAGARASVASRELASLAASDPQPSCRRSIGARALHRINRDVYAPARAARSAGLPARLLARGRRRDQLSPLLRHQRPRGAAHGERAGVRGDARFMLELAAAAKIDGLRIDHPDGLYDPARYFRKLQERYAQRVAALRGRRRPSTCPPLYVVVEKIIAPHEHLPEAWPVHGTTGYRFANVVNGVFVDADARDAHRPRLARVRRRRGGDFESMPATRQARDAAQRARRRADGARRAGCCALARSRPAHAATTRSTRCATR